MNKKRKINTKNVTIFLAIMLILFFVLAILTVNLYIRTNTPIIKSSVLYNESGNFDYSVCLKENEFISETCISEDRAFVTSLIETISFKLKHEYHASLLGDYKYSYKIQAVVSANERGDKTKVLYTKTNTLLEDEVDVKNTNLITINANTQINYQDYNNIITAFKKNYVLALDSTLKIVAEVSIVGTDENITSELKESVTYDYTMPLAEQTVNITSSKKTFSKSDSIVIQEVNKKYNVTRLASSIVYTLDILYIIFISVLVIKLKPRQNAYTAKVNRILKTYDTSIVKSKVPVPLRGMKIIEVASFEEMLDAHDNLQKPIVYFEMPHKSSCKFIIINDGGAFIYSISAYDRDEK